MKENKGKGVAGDEIEEEAINHSRPLVSPTIKVVPHASSKQKKTMSKSRVDTSTAHLGVNTSKPSNATPMTLLESENLAWEKFN